MAKKKKVTDRCLHCQQKFKLTADNTVVYLYSHPSSMEYSYITAVCNYCECKNWTFFTDHIAELMEIIQLIDCEVISQAFVEESVFLDWCKLYGKTPIQYADLNESQERTIAFWHFLLSADDEYLWREFE